MLRKHPHRLLIIWLISGIVLILGMVVVGGMTRLTHSGLSMTEWSFGGSFPPLSEENWHIEFDKYKASPEYKELHSHFSLDDFKSIYWWEYIHRMLGRFIGLVFIVPFTYFLFKRKVPKPIIPKLFIILGLGVLQALLGWFMVKSGLIDVPRVSHYRLAAHLSTAFITCSYIFWVMLEVYHDADDLRKRKIDLGPVFFIGLLMIQIVFGAFVAGLKAGWMHNTWPLMDGQFIADSVTSISPVWKSFLEGKSGVQFVHRTLAILVATYAIVLGLRARKSSESALRLSGNWLIALVSAQFVLGVLTLVLQVPIILGVLHQITALLLLLASVAFIFYNRKLIVIANETIR